MDVNEARRRLEAELAELAALDAAASGERATVTLDQQAQGRLSRMDALQRQAMAQATSARRAERARRIRAALARIEAGDYGDCASCGEPLEPARLAADPAIALCRDCMAG